MQQNKNLETPRPYPNNIRECIKRQGYTIGEVADEVGISRRTLTNYISGSVPIPRYCLEKIAQTIACEVEELVLPTTTTPSSQASTFQLLTDQEKELLRSFLALDDNLLTQPTEGDHKSISRRFLIQQLFRALGLAFAFSFGEPSPTELASSIVNEDLVRLFENTTVTNWELYHTGGAARVVNGIDTWIKEITNLSQLAQGTIWHKRTLALLTMSYQLQSCVLRDMMKYSQANIAYQRAFHVAQELDDYELMASALARQGVTLIQQKRPKEALIYLSGASDIINTHDVPLLKGHIFQGLAEAYALDQQAGESQRSIGQAEAYLGKRADTQERSLIRGVTVASISAQKGVNALLLHEYQLAIELIDASLVTYDPALIRGRARLIAQKAEAYYGLGMAGECTSHAFTAVTLARSAGSNKTEDRVKTLYRQLAQSPWGKEQSVIELGKTLSAGEE